MLKTASSRLEKQAIALNELMEVALGRDKADLVITNGALLNVYSGEIENGYAVAVKGERIAYVGKSAEHTVGENTSIIDASGKTILPGFIDGHTHLIWFYCIDEFLRYAIVGGTTTIISESAEFSFPLGESGVLEFLHAIRNQPIKVFTTIPPMGTISPLAEANAINVTSARKLFRQWDVVGLGESYWSGIIEGNQRLLELLAEAQSSRKTREGHTAGAKSNKLIALAAVGISSCHEPITEQEVLDRLRLGMHVLIREGSVRRELETISNIKDANVDFRRLALVTDGLIPRDLLSYGYIEYVLQKAIDLGFDPIKAVQMVTLNVAEHFGLDSDIGGIAPGKYADIVIVPSLRKICAEYVISNGKIIAQDGKLLVPPRKPDFSAAALNSIHLTERFKPDDFAIRVASPNPVRVRVIDMVTGLVTQEKQVELQPRDGLIQADVSQDILKVVAIDRTYRSGKKFIGLIKGFGLKAGGFASSASWDTSDIIAVGVDDRDIAMAVNRIIDLQGGVVLCAGGKVLTELPLRIAGLLTREPMEALMCKLDELQQRVAELGCPLGDAHLSLTILTTAAIPHFSICESGLVDLRSGKIFELLARQENGED